MDNISQLRYAVRSAIRPLPCSRDTILLRNEIGIYRKEVIVGDGYHTSYDIYRYKNYKGGRHRMNPRKKTYSYRV